MLLVWSASAVPLKNHCHASGLQAVAATLHGPEPIAVAVSAALVVGSTFVTAPLVRPSWPGFYQTRIGIDERS